MADDQDKKHEATDDGREAAREDEAAADAAKPASTPPASTPPASTPPASTPPAVTDDDDDDDDDDEAEEPAPAPRSEREATVAAAREIDRAAEGSPYRALPAHHSDHDHGLAHVTPVKLLVGILALLLVLTVITVAVTKIDLGGQWNLVVAMVIATIKAALVVTYFMHLRWDRSFNVLVFLSSVLFLILFLSLSLTDRNEYQPSIDLLEQTQQP